MHAILRQSLSIKGISKIFLAKKIPNDHVRHIVQCVAREGELEVELSAVFVFITILIYRILDI